MPRLDDRPYENLQSSWDSLPPTILLASLERASARRGSQGLEGQVSARNAGLTEDARRDEASGHRLMVILPMIARLGHRSLGARIARGVPRQKNGRIGASQTLQGDGKKIPLANDNYPCGIFQRFGSRLTRMSSKSSDFIDYRKGTTEPLRRPAGS